MAYNSPFDTLFDIFLEYNSSYLGYQGTLNGVLSDLSTLASDGPTEGAYVWGLHPSRIITAVIDYKVKHPDVPETETLLPEAIDVALGIYSNPINSAEVVAKLKDRIRSLNLDDLLTSPLRQSIDRVTWRALDPFKSENTVQRLIPQTRYDNLLFIALAHGGVAVGMDVYLRYCNAFKSKDSAFYVVRLSTQKLKDKEPRLSAPEIDYLKELAKGRRVVVFDEDISSGTTLKIARDYFSTKVFPSQKVMMFTNLDTSGKIIGNMESNKPSFDHQIISSPLYPLIPNLKHL